MTGQLSFQFPHSTVFHHWGVEAPKWGFPRICMPCVGIKYWVGLGRKQPSLGTGKFGFTAQKFYWRPFCSEIPAFPEHLTNDGSTQLIKVLILFCFIFKSAWFLAILSCNRWKKPHNASYLFPCSYNQTSEWLPSSKVFIEVVASTTRKIRGIYVGGA